MRFKAALTINDKTGVAASNNSGGQVAMGLSRGSENTTSRRALVPLCEPACVFLAE
jgi:hypothetical protein